MSLLPSSSFPFNSPIKFPIRGWSPWERIPVQIVIPRWALLLVKFVNLFLKVYPIIANHLGPTIMFDNL